ncbi:hypothetical protein BGY98DRAFT_1131009 [Russula aff. rugulosa BPL654]|nr:hypothetical protein BGY98DRAFT_1131009 [Russula aff. rugulosa BPL654]
MFTTSPESMRWKTLSRSTALIVAVMNPWFPREILLAAEKIHDFTGEQLNVAEAYLEKFGPIPRLCIDYVQDRAEALQHKDLCQGMVANLTSESLRKIVLDRGVFNLDEGSHWHLIFLVRRNELDVLERAYLEPISADVAIRFMTAINELQRLERIDLYHLFASVNDSRAVAGLVYESLGHTFLQEGVTLTLTPMIKTYARTLSHWKAQGEEQTSDSMDLDNSEITVSFPHNAAIVYEGTQTPIQPNHLYVNSPWQMFTISKKASRNPSLDKRICHQRRVGGSFISPPLAARSTSRRRLRWSKPWGR